jgi:hypothetical protein
MNLDKLKEEDEKFSILIDELNRKIETITEISNKIKECKYLINEVRKVISDEEYDFINKINKLVNDIRNEKEPELLIQKIDKLKYEVDYNYKRLKDLKNKLVEDLRKEIEYINNKLIVYEKINIKLLNEDMEIRTFPNNSTNLIELVKIREEAKKHLEAVHLKVTKLIRERVSLNDDEFKLLLELLSKGEIKLNKHNINISINIIKILIEKGIQIEVKI